MASGGEERIKTVRELCDQGRWPDVLASAKQWQAEEPSAPRALFFQGAALAAMGRFIEAETAYRRAAALDPSDFKTWNNLAGILFDSLHKPMEALRCMERAMKLEPRNKLGWSNLASMVGRLGRHEKALEFAGRALALDPKMVEAHLHKAAAARALGKTGLVEEASHALAAIEANKFKRAG
jgi:tetratricopeptide (TPR) repeat protein